MSVHVVKPGALSTLQDLGRHGFQRLGVVADGVMDEWSHRVANLLVGNPEREATLEITLMGPSLEFRETALIAICGAALSPRIGEHAVPQDRPVLVSAGSRLDFGKRESGMRAYLAVHGGFDVAPVMNSKSTYLRGGFGGLDGRALRKGDTVCIGAGDAAGVYARLARRLHECAEPFAAAADALIESLPTTADVQTVRVMTGQQWPAFSDDAQAQFFGAEFRLSPQSDRMGFRFEGPKLALREPLEMISEAVAFGTVQVPPDGNPIVLMADRQTTGGYPKIADVASIDLPRLAQLVPQQRMRFARIALDEAQRLYLGREAQLERLRLSVERLKQETA